MGGEVEKVAAKEAEHVIAKAVEQAGVRDAEQVGSHAAEHAAEDAAAKSAERTEADEGLGDLFRGGPPKASELSDFAERQGWHPSQTENGPLKYTDDNGVVRMTVKRGSPRTPGSEHPHVELRGPDGGRIDPSGNPVSRRSPGNHTPIDWDL